MNCRDISEHYEHTLSIRYFDVAHRSCTRFGKQVPRLSLMFDCIERFYSKCTTSTTRWRPTKTYRTPPVSWGVECREIQPLFSRWLGKAVLVHNSVYRLPAVLWGLSYLLLRSICRFSPTFSQWLSAWWTTETRLNSAYFYPSLLRSKAGNTVSRTRLDVSAE